MTSTKIPKAESWATAKARVGLERIREAQDKQVYPYFKQFESGGLHSTIDGKPVLNFSSNDYLGLTTHPKVKEASIEAVKKFSCGLSSSRVQATTTAHVELEERLAAWFGYESCLVFTTGYQAMLGTLMSLADKDTTIILDNLAHACILDGTFLAAGVPRNGCEIRFFNHNSARSLRRCLKTRERKNALVCIEGIYSLDGDEAKILELVEACEEDPGAVLIVDDAHGTGTLGQGGRGIHEKYGLDDTQIPIVISTFSKTFGGIGGILLGDREVVDHVKHMARSFLFSASLPVPVVAAAATILDMLEDHGEELVAELHEKAAYMRKSLLEIGFDLGMSDTHIMPVMCNEERKALFTHVAMLESGVMMVPITYPGVKLGEERLRLNVTRGHSREDMDQALELLQIYGEAFFILSGDELDPMES